MSDVTRRDFLKRSGQAAVAIAIADAALASSWAQGASAITRVVIDPAFSKAPLDRNLFGSFLEHLGRAIYEGIYDPGSRLADANGFRTDVIREVHGLGVPIIRYPGGNFVSGYHWLDGVGPKKDRPHVLDRAWNTLETNQFGTNEFITWGKQVGAEPLLGMNFGTGTAEMAAALVEYCNYPGGTKWSDLRRQHGYEQPHNVKYWCLGNEMDGPWQIGHMGAREYGEKAVDAARQIRVIDANVNLIACGSSGPFMPTYLEWDQQVLESCYELADGISLHRYWGNNEETLGDSSTYLAMNLAMDRQIEEIAAVCDLVRGRKRTNKTLFLSFDEWNVWYRARSGDAVNGHGKAAPHLLEEVYNLEDALLVGGLLNSLIRHSDRVRLACLAQLVNVIAPLMTNANGVLKQTIYYPYSWALRHAHGRAVHIVPEGPTYEVAHLGRPTEAIGIIGPGLGSVPYLDIVTTLDTETKTASLFILNRDLEKPRDVDITWRDLSPAKVNSWQTITGNDRRAVNTFEQPNRVAPQNLDAPKVGPRMTFQVPAGSYSVMSLAL
ncbi:MAG TPA: alpha-N-arabinofuranosidase [Candidatus Sulfotelmatobacter sp.]|nr:alpha-N-arabinofuranosidase [Candidatus Sulfotelmatobacter sp.]